MENTTSDTHLQNDISTQSDIVSTTSGENEIIDEKSVQVESLYYDLC
jgi:hypothetical protein